MASSDYPKPSVTVDVVIITLRGEELQVLLVKRDLAPYKGRWAIPGGFVEWLAGTGDEDSYAVSIAPAQHWPLVDCVAIVSESHKKTGSREGHAIASTSPLQQARVADAPRRLDLCRRAILDCDFSLLVGVVELDSDMMHAVMMTSSPALHYWMPESLQLMAAVRVWRQEGIDACYSVDAGPNVHILCLENHAQEVLARLARIPSVKNILLAHVGGPARLIEETRLKRH